MHTQTHHTVCDSLFYFFVDWGPQIPLLVWTIKLWIHLQRKWNKTILKSLTRKSDQGRFWHQIDPDSQKSQLIVMAIMDRLFWETYNMTSARQTDKEAHIKCVSPFWGSNNGVGGTHQHTNSPRTVWWSWHAGRSTCVPSSAGKPSAAI